MINLNLNLIKKFVIDNYLFIIIAFIIYFKKPINIIFQKFYIYPLILLFVIYKNYNNPEKLLVLCPIIFVLIGLIRTNNNSCIRKIKEKFTDNVECPYKNKDGFIEFNYDQKVTYNYKLKNELCKLFNDDYSCEYHPKIEKVMCWKVIYDNNDKPKLDEFIFDLDGEEYVEDFDNEMLLPSEKSLDEKDYKLYKKHLPVNSGIN
jgi:hypothetical protein